jgi:hypothetical protein
MQSAMWLASIFGPFLMILGIWMLFYHANMMKVITSIKGTPGVMYVLGMWNLLIGLTILSQFNMWMWGLSLLVTILGWVMLIRGLMYYFMPHYILSKKMTTGNCLKVKGIVLLIWGFGLCWLAFWM